MISRCIEWGVASLLGVLIVSDGILMVRVKSLERSYLAANSEALQRHDARNGPIPIPEYFTALGDRLQDVPNSRTGWAVRYAARTCGYCSRDTQWQRLAPQLESADYEVIVLLPRAEEEFPEKDVVPKEAPQAVFVPMEWIKRFRLTATPSLLIFSRQGQLIWSRQGMLVPSDPESAMRAIKRHKG